MSAVAQRTDGVDTLAAWLTAYLAAPATADKVSFTLTELMTTAGLQRDITTESAMCQALKLNGLVLKKRNGPQRLRAWFRPLANRATPSLDEQEAHARERVQHHIDCAADWSLMTHRLQTRDIRDRMDAAVTRRNRAAAAILAGLALDHHRVMHRGCDDIDAELARHGKPPLQLLLDPTNDRRARPRGVRP